MIAPFCQTKTRRGRPGKSQPLFGGRFFPVLLITVPQARQTRMV